MEDIILVDENDSPIGVGEKLQTHIDGKLHRAFSIFVFNDLNELMLQKRASSKYHSGGLWTNTCCSHPHPSEDTIVSAHIRLKEEMGFDCDLKEVFSFIYKTNFENLLIENEFDHVLIGKYNQNPKINLEEADDFRWIKLDELQKDIYSKPTEYTYWFKIALPRLIEYLAINPNPFDYQPHTNQ